MVSIKGTEFLLNTGRTKQTDTIKKCYIYEKINENGLIFCGFVEYSCPGGRTK
jgi:hypothetical protein